MEVLGEHGWIGLAFFMGTLAFAVRNLWRARREAARIQELSWCYELSGALLVSFLVLAGCSNFIGIAFQPIFWYLFATSTCLREHVHRYTVAEPTHLAIAASIVLRSHTPQPALHNLIDVPRRLL